MYSAVLLLHSWVRWLVLIAGLLAVVRALMGMSAGKPWTSSDARGTLLFSIALDIQFLLGLVLYAALSPITRTAFSDMGNAMRNATLRFWAVEHLFGMIVAIGLVHVGNRIIKRKPDVGGDRHRLAALFMGLALVAIVLSMPWPWGSNARPLLRF
jgi:hypothetical protein